MKLIFSTLIGLVFVVMPGLAAQAQDSTPAKQTLFENVRVFDGVSDALSGPTNVLVEDNVITSVSPQATAGSDATVIDGGGRVLMPGLIEAHSHLLLSGATIPDVLFQEESYMQVKGTKMAHDMLMNGVTTTRDMAGSTFGLKRAIDEGAVLGPRIYPSGAMISQTSGHGDFRLPVEQHRRFYGNMPATDRKSVGLTVDGVPEVLAAVRDQLRLGASQIKLAIGGSVSGLNDPLDSTQFMPEEIEAAVTAAADWGTYVTVHGYGPRAINRAIDAGIKSVEHGQLLDEDTLKRMAKEGIWLSIQPFTECHEASLTESQNAKQAIVCEGTGKVYEMIKKIPKLKVVHGTDIFISPGPGIGVSEQVEQMERLLDWFTPYEILKMSTGNVTELLQLSGPRNPYPGVLGRVQEGALADMLLVDGNPLEDLGAVTDRDNLRIIMKDGKIFKNTLD